jgi:hypothetical protein
VAGTTTGKPDAKTVQALAAEVRRRKTGLAHTDYQTRPIDWMVDKLGVKRESLIWSLNYEGHEWDGTPDPLAAVLRALADGENVGVESGTGTGKTFLGGAITLWFLAAFEESIVVTAAPKEAQLKLHIWKEIGYFWPRFKQHFPDAEFLASGKVYMRPAAEDREKWAATAFVCGVGADEASATKAQGFHAEHMLIITEETPGIHSAIMTAFENTCTASHNLRLGLGNPDSQQDELHRFCLQPYVRHVRVSALDHPNVVLGSERIVPGAVSLAAVERREVLYAHTPALYHSRVRGVSPKQAYGVALAFNEADHLETWDVESLIVTVKDQRWPVYGGIDFGHWRFAFLMGLADRAKRLHIPEELFSQRETLGTRASDIHALLERYNAPERTRIWGDAANPQDIVEINQAFKRMESPYRVVPVEHENKLRKASVERLNDLLGRTALLFRRDIGSGQEWRLGQSVASEGVPMVGSRLLWEMLNWRYPEPREAQAQVQDPDDDTADGADMIAALRYMVMSWWSGAKFELPAPEPDKNRDLGLERYLADNLKRQLREERAFNRETRAIQRGLDAHRRQYAQRNSERGLEKLLEKAAKEKRKRERGGR